MSLEIPGVSGSDVYYFGIIKAAEVCRFISALDMWYRILAHQFINIAYKCRSNFDNYKHIKAIYFEFLLIYLKKSKKSYN